MNTISFKVPDAMALDVAKATDILGMAGSDALAFEATRLLLQTVLGSRRGRPYKHKPLSVRAANGKRGRR